jgi:hypothetical protein
MKPYLREKKTQFPGKHDVHPLKGWMNWWEDFYNCISRRKAKQNLQREISEDSDV